MATWLPELTAYLVKDGYGAKWMMEIGSLLHSSGCFRIAYSGSCGLNGSLAVSPERAASSRRPRIPTLAMALWVEDCFRTRNRLVRRARPRAEAWADSSGHDFIQTGVGWNRKGYPSIPGQAHRLIAEEIGVCTTFGRAIVPASSSRFLGGRAAISVASIAALACTNTWNAYNNLCGRSNYINPDSLPPRPTVNARLIWRDSSLPPKSGLLVTTIHPLSFERPEPANNIFD